MLSSVAFNLIMYTEEISIKYWWWKTLPKQTLMTTYVVHIRNNCSWAYHWKLKPLEDSIIWNALWSTRKNHTQWIRIYNFRCWKLWQARFINGKWRDFIFRISMLSSIHLITNKSEYVCSMYVYSGLQTNIMWLTDPSRNRRFIVRISDSLHDAITIIHKVHMSKSTSALRRRPAWMV